MTDRALYIAMTGASANLQAQASVAQNLANADTVGFQATLDGTVAAPVTGPGLASRVATEHRTLGVSGTPGALQNTGGDLDVALHADRWLAVQAPDGSTAYTRAGSLQLTPNGLLTTARRWRFRRTRRCTSPATARSRSSRRASPRRRSPKPAASAWCRRPRASWCVAT